MNWFKAAAVSFGVLAGIVGLGVLADVTNGISLLVLGGLAVFAWLTVLVHDIWWSDTD